MVLAILLGFLALLLLAGSGVLGLFAWRNFKTASLLGRRLSRIAKLRPGARKARGQIVPLDKPLRSPVTDQPCVYYRLRIYEERTEWNATGGSPEGVIAAGVLGGAVGVVFYQTANWEDSDTRAEHSWLSILEDELSIPLVIQDDTGEVEVDLRGATVIPKQKARIATGDGHPPPSRLTDLLREEYDLHIVDARGWIKTLHFVEEVLPVGAKVTVVGHVELLESEDLCFRKEGDILLVSERDVAKEGRSAQGLAMGYAAGAGGALVAGLGFLSGSIFLAMRVLLVGR